MELYLLDNLLRRDRLIDRFESLIWTERFKSIGDMDLSIHASHEHRSLFTVGSRWALSESKRVMTVDTVEEKTDEDGRDMINITGISLEQILDDRLAYNTRNGSAVSPNWVLTGTPMEILRQLFKMICIDGVLSPLDKIPFIGIENIFPIDTLAEPTTSITVEMEPQTLLEIIQQICDIYDIGYRMVRNGDQSQLLFNFYMGSDRTSRQSTYQPVIFSEGLDNLKNVSSLSSVTGYKNVALVYSQNGTKEVFAQPDDTLMGGFDRKVLYVDAKDIELPAGAALDAALQQRGLQELAKHRRLMGFDGEIPQTGKYKYGVHYQLGDIVEMRNSDGASNNMRVSEQIFVSDSSGDRSYPTLSLDRFLFPGTWLSWDYNQVWNDVLGVWSQV